VVGAFALGLFDDVYGDGGELQLDPLPVQGQRVAQKVLHPHFRPRGDDPGNPDHGRGRGRLQGEVPGRLAQLLAAFLRAGEGLFEQLGS